MANIYVCMSAGEEEGTGEREAEKADEIYEIAKDCAVDLIIANHSDGAAGGT